VQNTPLVAFFFWGNEKAAINIILTLLTVAAFKKRIKLKQDLLL